MPSRCKTLPKLLALLSTFITGAWHFTLLCLAALAAGGKDHGAPGERKYHPGYYGAFVIDPDGNNIEAVYHGEATRSAPSVKVTF